MKIIFNNPVQFVQTFFWDPDPERVHLCLVTVVGSFFLFRFFFYILKICCFLPIIRFVGLFLSHSGTILNDKMGSRKDFKIFSKTS